jgi:hypothetical protein
MRETTISAVVTIVIILLISFLGMNGKSTMFDATGGVGTYSFWLGVIAVVIGLILSVISETRKYGQGILIGGGLLLLIGLSLCSGGFGLIK